MPDRHKYVCGIKQGFVCCEKQAKPFWLLMDKLVFVRRIDVADARKLPLNDNSVDLICAHPPYADIIQYSKNIEGDLSHLSIKPFLTEMGKAADECYRVLKKDKYCAILMGDTRKKGMVQPLAFETMRVFELSGFKTKEIIIKEQHNCKATGYWKTNSIKFNFLLLAHEYMFVFKK